MTYIQGGFIDAIDFNTFRTSVLNVYDVGSGSKGYGQIASAGEPAIPSVSVGDVVGSVEWEAFRNAAQVCSDHQPQPTTTTFPPAAELDIGEIIEAHDGTAPPPLYDIPDSLTIITNKSNEFDVGSMTTFLNWQTDTRVAAWSNQLQHRFTATFPTVDDARYFFNSGGDIRFSGSRTGGSATPQNTSWSTVLSNMNRVVMTYNETFILGGGAGWSGSLLGYYDLTTSFQQIAIGVDLSGGPYGGYGGDNNVTIEARTVDGPGGANGDRGRNLEFRILYTDGHTSIWFDSVDGTITSVIEYTKATSQLIIETPVYVKSVSLASGT